MLQTKKSGIYQIKKSLIYTYIKYNFIVETHTDTRESILLLCVWKAISAV